MHVIAGDIKAAETCSDFREPPSTRPGLLLVRNGRAASVPLLLRCVPPRNLVLPLCRPSLETVVEDNRPGVYHYAVICGHRARGRHRTRTIFRTGSTFCLLAGFLAFCRDRQNSRVPIGKNGSVPGLISAFRRGSSAANDATVAKQSERSSCVAAVSRRRCSSGR